MAQVARDLGINEGTLGNWVNADKRRGEGNGVLNEDEREPGEFDISGTAAAQADRAVSSRAHLLA